MNTPFSLQPLTTRIPPVTSGTPELITIALASEGKMRISSQNERQWFEWMNSEFKEKRLCSTLFVNQLIIGNITCQTAPNVLSYHNKLCGAEVGVGVLGRVKTVASSRVHKARRTPCCQRPCVPGSALPCTTQFDLKVARLACE